MSDLTRSTPNSSSPLIARCPNCHTSFRLTQEQRIQANGMVRCGNCMRIFDAERHCITLTPPEFQNHESPPTHQPMRPKDNDSDWFERHSPHSTAPLKPSPSDETWALQLLEELEAGLSNSASSAADSRPAHSTPLTDVDGSGASTPTSSASITFTAAPHDSAPTTTEAAHTRTELTQTDDAASPSPATPTKKAWIVNASRMRRKAPVLASLTFISLVVALITLRPTDIESLWLNTQTAFCQWTDCQKPTDQDWSQYRLSFQIRTTNSTPATLQANAILTNDANFDQPFPSFTLQFSDINGSLITEHHFPPPEYLQGDMVQTDQLPAKQSIQFVLTLPDPGPDAVSYQAYIADFGQNDFSSASHF